MNTEALYVEIKNLLQNYEQQKIPCEEMNTQMNKIIDAISQKVKHPDFNQSLHEQLIKFFTIDAKFFKYFSENIKNVDEETKHIKIIICHLYEDQLKIFLNVLQSHEPPAPISIPIPTPTPISTPAPAPISAPTPPKTYSDYISGVKKIVNKINEICDTHNNRTYLHVRSMTALMTQYTEQKTILDNKIAKNASDEKIAPTLRAIDAIIYAMRDLIIANLNKLCTNPDFQKSSSMREIIEPLIYNIFPKDKTKLLVEYKGGNATFNNLNKNTKLEILKCIYKCRKYIYLFHIAY